MDGSDDPDDPVLDDSGASSSSDILWWFCFVCSLAILLRSAVPSYDSATPGTYQPLALPISAALLSARPGPRLRSLFAEVKKVSAPRGKAREKEGHEDVELTVVGGGSGR